MSDVSNQNTKAYFINRMHLHTNNLPGQSVNITSMYDKLVIEESIYKPFIAGSVTVYDGAGYHSGTTPFECTVEFSTDYRPHFRGFSQSYQSNAYSFSNVFGFFNNNITSESNVSSIDTVRINGLRFKSSSGWTITSGQFLLYRYKES